jgi:hypothetical protein
MSNHLEHPEDTILNGDLSVLNWFIEPGSLSVKIDGCPAIVWGKNPTTNRFFVGTKSVFNKIKIKINHTHKEINENHSGEVADILHLCYDCLPRTTSILQGDIIGVFDGSDVYCPNVVTYRFDQKVSQKLIIAPHTQYKAKNDLRETISSPLKTKLESDENVLFVQPDSYIIHNQESFSDLEDVVSFARQMATTVRFSDSTKQVKEIKKSLNQCIRGGCEVDEDNVSELVDCDPNLIRFWKLIKSMKEDCLYLCRNDGPEAYIKSERIDSEGYVFSNSHGTYKLVNREVFSYYNFNYGKFAQQSSR